MCMYIFKELEKQDGDVWPPTPEVFTLRPLTEGKSVF